MRLVPQQAVIHLFYLEASAPAKVPLSAWTASAQIATSQL